MSLSEQDGLVERARRDPEAFGELYDKFYSQIFGYVLKRMANMEIAQDITSEVFFKALNNLWRYQKYNNTPFSSWLYRIATNQINDYFRKKKHMVTSLEGVHNTIGGANPSVETEIQKAQNELERQEDFLVVHQSISKLPVKYQEVITLKYFEERTNKEISQILQKPEGTVKSLIHRGLKRLAELME